MCSLWRETTYKQYEQGDFFPPLSPLSGKSGNVTKDLSKRMGYHAIQWLFWATKPPHYPTKPAFQMFCLVSFVFGYRNSSNELRCAAAGDTFTNSWLAINWRERPVCALYNLVIQLAPLLKVISCPSLDSYTLCCWLTCIAFVCRNNQHNYSKQKKWRWK